MQLDAYYITTTAEFNQHINFLDLSARRGSVPDVFCVGLDLEYVSRTEWLGRGHKMEEISWVEEKDIQCIPCVLQLSTDTCCLVINLKDLGLPLPIKLVHILKSEAWIKFGVGVSNDLTYLSLGYKLGNCGGSIELKNLAILANFQQPNLCRLYHHFFNQVFNDDPTPHDWLTPLTEEEFEYAALDAIYVPSNWHVFDGTDDTTDKKELCSSQFTQFGESTHRRFCQSSQ